MELNRIEQLTDLPFILVSGQARSGTTILTRAMAHHPAVLSNGLESTWLRDLLELLHANLDDESRMRQCLVEPERFAAIFREAAFQILFPQEIWPDQVPQAVSTFSSLKQDVFPRLRDLLPRVKLLNIVRNGIEVVSSRMRHRAIGQLPFERHCRAWSRAVDVVQWAEGDPFFKLVRHEQLLAEQSPGLFREIQQWAGLDASDDCHQFVEQNLINTTSGPDDSIQRPAQLAGRAERWRDWTSEQQTVFQQICGPAMDYFGYPIPW
ncbi:MAG: sulfotransferase [Mariniblastus sp.]|nr:sulfotransferase [Mariniblastus sp.]